MMNLQVSRNAFRTQPAFVNRKIIARLNSNHMVVLHQEVHAALDRAVRTMRGHNFVDDSIRTPAIIWRVVEMWSKRVYDSIEMFDFAHGSVSACGAGDSVKPG